MKTRSSNEQARHGLPPPPAPTASDANPWQMSSPAAGSTRGPRHPRSPGWPPTPRTPGQPGRQRPRSRLWIPLLVLFAFLGSGVQTAIRALRQGEAESAIGALVVLAVVAVFAVRRMLTRRRG